MAGGAGAAATAMSRSRRVKRLEANRSGQTGRRTGQEKATYPGSSFGTSGFGRPPSGRFVCALGGREPYAVTNREKYEVFEGGSGGGGGMDGAAEMRRGCSAMGNACAGACPWLGGMDEVLAAVGLAGYGRVDMVDVVVGGWVAGNGWRIPDGWRMPGWDKSIRLALVSTASPSSASSLGSTTRAGAGAPTVHGPRPTAYGLRPTARPAGGVYSSTQRMR